MQGDIHTGRMRFAFRWLAWAFALFAAANGPSRPSAQKRKGQKSQKASAPRERRQISRSPNLESPQVPSRVPAPPGLASSWMRPRLGPRRRPRKQYTGCAPSAGAARLLWPWSTNGRRAVSTPPLTRSPAIPRPPLSSPVSLDDHEPLTRAPTTDVMETDALVWGGGVEACACHQPLRLGRLRLGLGSECARVGSGGGAVEASCGRNLPPVIPTKQLEPREAPGCGRKTCCRSAASGASWGCAVDARGGEPAGLTPPNIFCGLPDLTLPDARLATGPAPTEPAGRFMACEEPSHADCRQRGCVPPGGPRIRGGEIRGAFKELRRR